MGREKVEKWGKWFLGYLFNHSIVKVTLFPKPISTNLYKIDN